MIVRAAATLACLCWCFGASAADAQAREEHGVGEVYSGSGVAIAWAVLRGASESATLVVLRVAAPAYASVEIVGRNPFTQRERALLPLTAVSRPVEARIPRDGFAELPRTELRFRTSSQAADAPAVTVYYLGVPDTTPEFASEAALDSYLASRIDRMRPGKSP